MSFQCRTYVSSGVTPAYQLDSHPVALPVDTNQPSDCDASTHQNVFDKETTPGGLPLPTLTWADIYKQRHPIGPLLSDSLPSSVPAASQGCVVRLCCTTNECVSNHTTNVLRMLANFFCGAGTEVYFERLSDDEGGRATSKGGKVPLMVIEPRGAASAGRRGGCELHLAQHGQDVISMRRCGA